MKAGNLFRRKMDYVFEDIVGMLSQGRRRTKGLILAAMDFDGRPRHGNRLPNGRIVNIPQHMTPFYDRVFAHTLGIGNAAKGDFGIGELLFQFIQRVLPAPAFNNRFQFVRIMFAAPFIIGKSRVIGQLRFSHNLTQSPPKTLGPADQGKLPVSRF